MTGLDQARKQNQGDLRRVLSLRVPLSPVGIAVQFAGIGVVISGLLAISGTVALSPFTLIAATGAFVVILFVLRWSGAAISLGPERRGLSLPAPIRRALFTGGLAVCIGASLLVTLTRSVIPALVAAAILLIGAALIVPIGHRLITRASSEPPTSRLD